MTLLTAENRNRSFGQGAAGYGRYFGAGYGDLFIGDYMSEALFPILLHQDTRYSDGAAEQGGPALVMRLSRKF